jgi:hypothetical protein
MSKLTPIEIKDRLTVLFDAYQTTFRKDFYFERAEYLRVDQNEDWPGSPVTCHACVLGTLFLGKMLGSSGEIATHLNNPLSRDIVDELRTVFDEKTLAYAEALFEGCAHISGPLADFWESPAGADDDTLVRILQKPRRPSKFQGRRILMHLIENRGEFDLNKFTAGYEADNTYDVLSPEAMEVLKRYDLGPKET